MKERCSDSHFKPTDQVVMNLQVLQLPENKKFARSVTKK